MKLALIIDDEAWFWILDETGRCWEAWYEICERPAVRCPKLDRFDVNNVTEIMGLMAIAAQNDEDPISVTV